MKTNDSIEKFSNALNHVLQEIEKRKLEFKAIPKLEKDLVECKQNIISYTEKIRNDNKKISHYIRRGMLYNDLKEYKMAMSDFNYAITLVENQLNPSENIEQNSTIAKCNKQLRQNYEFEIYYGRGDSFAGMGNYVEAIEDYNLSLSKKPISMTGGPLLDAVYTSRGITYYMMNSFGLALKDLDEAIKIASLKFIPLFNKGLLLFSMKQYEEAIPIFSKVLDLNENYYLALFFRGLSYQTLGNIDLAYIDYSRYLYFCLSHNKRDYFINLLAKFYAYPYTIKTILNRLNIHNFNLISGLYSEVIVQIEDFLLLIEYIELSLLDVNTILSIKAILYYYLKGSVDSFLIFDNKLDNGEYGFSAMELYYYSKVAFEVNIDSLPIWEDAVNKLNAKNNKDDIDLYYLGQLYLLNECTEKAIQCFAQSNHYIYSQLMLCQLKECSHLFNIKSEIIEKVKVLHKIIELNEPCCNLSIFEDFFHLKESLEAIEYLNIDNPSDLIKSFCRKNIWDLFILSPTTRENLSMSIIKMKAQKRLKGAYIDFDNLISLLKIQNRNSDPDKLKNEIIEYENKLKNLFYMIDIAIKDGADPENQIGLSIKDWEHSNYLAYLDIIKYYLLKEKINSEQVFNLLIYLIHRIEIMKYKLPSTNALLNLGSACVISLGVNQVFIDLVQCICKIVLPLYQEEEYCPNGDNTSDYRKFKKNIWRIMVDAKGEDIVNKLKSILSQKSILNTDLM